MLKKIENIFKNIIRLVFNTNKNPIIIDKPSDIFNFAKKILLLRNDRIGDLLISSGIIRNLRNALPNAKIDILLSLKNISAKNSVSKYINEIFIYNKKFYRTLKLVLKLRKSRYDLIIDLFDKASTTSGILIKLLQPKYSLCTDKGNKNVYTHCVPQLDRRQHHIIERTAQHLMAFGIVPERVELTPEYDIAITHQTHINDKSKLNFNFEKDRNILRLGINLAGSSRLKFWGAGNNIILIKEILKRYIDVEIVLFGTIDYAAIIRKIIGSAVDRRLIHAPYSDSFDEYAAMISTCDLVITPDTSAVHLASAFKIPAVVMYEMSDIKASGMPWTPYKSPYIALEARESISSGISVSQVMEAVTRLIIDNS